MPTPKDRQTRDKNNYADVPTDDRTIRLVQVTGTEADIPVSIGTEGFTDHFNGTASTTPANVPSTAGTNITRVAIESLATKKSDVLSVSFDGGTTFKAIPFESILTWEPKEITQIVLQANVASIGYEIIMNRQA